MASAKKITLKSSDGESFEVEAAVAAMFPAITPTADDNSASTEITISNVTGKILAKIIEYCEKQVQTASATDEADRDSLKKWEAEFVSRDAETLFDLYHAAKDLKMENIMDLVVLGVQNAIKDKTVEEIRKFFNIENDFTPEEEEEVRRENQWAFE